MAILENIRKRTTVLILIIGLALFAFVISGVFTSSDFAGGKTGSTVAEINGNSISIDEFRQKVESASRRFGPTASSMLVVNQVWDQEVRNSILGQQFDDLGIDIERDQIMNYIKTIPSYTQNPQFLDESGVFDENKFRNFIVDLKRNNSLQYELWLQDEQSIIQNAKQQAYFNLIKAGLGATLKEGELDYKLANNKIDIKYVRLPYSSVPDSTITITKSEIQTYINGHKEDYKQEAARDIQFIYFEEKPSLEDENAVKEEITKLLDPNIQYEEDKDIIDTLAGFRNTTDIADFLDRNSDIKLDTIYKAKRDLSAIFADSLISLNMGETYGPYRDGNFFKVSKMIDKKVNGSVKSSHILIGYEGATRVNPDVKRTKEEAEKKANELFREMKSNIKDFAIYARDNSDGPTGPQGGDLGYFQQGKLADEFDTFIFGNSVGAVDLVETEFGFHIIKIDDKQDIYQIGTLAREIEPSETTINSLFTDATKFEMESISGEKPFTDLAKEGGYLVRPVNTIKVMDENLPGLSTQRSIVQWAFNDQTEVGSIKRFNINNGYVISQLTAAHEEGLMSVEDASTTILAILRKERKAAQLIGANKGKSLEDLAKDNNVSVSNASALTVKSPTIPGAGREAAVVGTAFAMNEGETSGLIEGETGVFLISITKKEEAPKLDNYSTYAISLKRSSGAKVNAAVYNALKESSEIEDNRATFY
ncbi:MAG: SurA N-terminal domain-containing protein [Maribacter sp.]|nr:SurA N-terminal domain-containing protein [Maribacter sp.]